MKIKILVIMYLLIMNLGGIAFASTVDEEVSYIMNLYRTALGSKDYSTIKRISTEEFAEQSIKYLYTTRSGIYVERMNYYDSTSLEDNRTYRYSYNISYIYSKKNGIFFSSIRHSSSIYFIIEQRDGKLYITESNIYKKDMGLWFLLFIPVIIIVKIRGTIRKVYNKK